MDDAAQQTAADLLHFADVRDIDEFIDGLARYERGEWTADQFRVFRLARGTYGQRQPDVSMLRVKIPQGILTAEQLRAIATVADDYSRGFGHVTTRQNVQLHFIQMKDVPAAMHVLAAVGLTTKEACGNTVRNVTGCALAGVCPDEPFDLTPYAQAVTRTFLRKAENQALPRKFKIAFSGCDSDCAMGAINDVGCIARVVDGVPGFRVKVAGGLSTTPENAHLLYDFLPADRLLGVIEAVLAVFNALGNRQNKARARMKYVVRKLGWDGYRAAFEKELAAVEAAGKSVQPIDAEPGALLSRQPVRLRLACDAQASPELERFQESNVIRQKQPGQLAVIIRLVRGDITGAQLRGLADLALRFGDGMVRTSIDQNLVLRFVDEDDLAPLHGALAALGLATPDAGTIADVTSCPGADSCNLAVTSSRELASALTARLENANGASAAVAAARDLDIKISGCPNSCGQHHIAGIGFHGGMRRVGGKVVPEYTLHLGGGIDGDGAKFGRQVVKLPARRVPEALLRLLHLYEERREPGERALTFFRRVGEDEVKAAVAELTRLDDKSAPEDFLDLGSEQTFVVATGPGECAT
jgi:sulfite reductase (NADPH) hemoprotein beta-component